MPQPMLFFEDDLDGWYIKKYFNNEYGNLFQKHCFIYVDDKFLLFCNVPYSIAEFVVGCNDASGYFSSGNTATLKYVMRRFIMLSLEYQSLEKMLLSTER